MINSNLCSPTVTINALVLLEPFGLTARSVRWVIPWCGECVVDMAGCPAAA
jgi:hypothetical protein